MMFKMALCMYSTNTNNFMFVFDYCSLQGNPVVMANAKLALFYDWLAYNPEMDNIMNIGQSHVCRVRVCLFVSFN